MYCAKYTSLWRDPGLAILGQSFASKKAVLFLRLRRTGAHPEGTTEYFYDERHRLAQEIRPDGSQLDYQYDAVGNRTLVTVTFNNQIIQQTRYDYDALNRLHHVTDELAADPTEPVTTYTYDDVGNMDTVTYSNGLTTDYEYNEVNQLTDVFTRNAANDELISHFNYTLDDTGRRTVITENTGRTTAYCHDNLYRLTMETVFDTAQTLSDGCLTADARNDASYSADYEYDWTGNRTYQTIDGVETQYLYDANDRLQSQGGTTYSYDANGNTLTETLDGEITEYVYNGKNQLVSQTQVAITTEFGYNPNGIRNSKTEGNQTTLYLIDENRDYQQVLTEVIDNQISVNYTYGHDLVRQQRAANESFYHYDGLGSTRALSDSTAAITDTYNYQAFGELLDQTGTTENSYLFTGEQFDQGLNQYYLRARYYDQGIGRFPQQDTWAGNNYDPISLNKYIYAASDPAYFIDPTGNIFSLSGFGPSFTVMGTLATTSTTVGGSAIGKVLGGLIGAGLGYLIVDTANDLISANAPAINRVLEQKRVREQARVERRSRGRPILYHYTDKISAGLIGASGVGFVTPSFRGLGTNGNTRPAGFYATDIPPWDVSRTQRDLSAIFYGGNINENVSWFVAVDGTLFNPVYGTSNEFVYQGVGTVKLDVITIGPNLMFP